MTTVASDETALDPDPEVAEGDSDEHVHPSDWQYVKIAIVLAILTALEVFTYFESVHHLGRNALVISLVVMMVAKIFLVVAWFMHLKFDNKTFTRLLVSGILLALGVYTVMLTTFLIWD